MSKLHKTKIPLYNLNFIFTQDKLKFAKHFNVPINADADGWCSWDDNTIGVCVKNTGNPDKVISVLAHECFHASMVVADTVGLETTPRADEALAYVISWLVEYCLKCMDKDSIIIRKDN